MMVRRRRPAWRRLRRPLTARPRMSRFLTNPPSPSQLAGRCAEAAAEAPVEVGDVAAAARVRDLGHLRVARVRTRQHPPRFLKPQLEHALREARTRIVQQILPGNGDRIGC